MHHKFVYDSLNGTYIVCASVVGDGSTVVLDLSLH